MSSAYRLFYFRLFAERLDRLEVEVTQLACNDPEHYRKHPQTKLLASVYRAITHEVPANPDDPAYRLGHTLGAGNTHWRRVKKGLPQRYRLFFRFSTAALPVIVYVWLNDEHTLRKEGAKSDVYAVFQRMLARGDVPDSVKSLLDDADPAEGSR